MQLKDKVLKLGALENLHIIIQVIKFVVHVGDMIGQLHIGWKHTLCLVWNSPNNFYQRSKSPLDITQVGTLAWFL